MVLVVRVGQQQDMIQGLLTSRSIGVLLRRASLRPSVSRPLTSPSFSASAISSGRSSRRVGSPPVKITCGMPASQAFFSRVFHSPVLNSRLTRSLGATEAVRARGDLIGQGAVQAVGRGEFLRIRRDTLHIQVGDRVEVFGVDQGVDLVQELIQVFSSHS